MNKNIVGIALGSIVIAVVALAQSPVIAQQQSGKVVSVPKEEELSEKQIDHEKKQAINVTGSHDSVINSYCTPPSHYCDDCNQVHTFRCCNSDEQCGCPGTSRKRMASLHSLDLIKNDAD